MGMVVVAVGHLQAGKTGPLSYAQLESVLQMPCPVARSRFIAWAGGSEPPEPRAWYDPPSAGSRQASTQNPGPGAPSATLALPAGSAQPAPPARHDRRVLSRTPTGHARGSASSLPVHST